MLAIGVGCGLYAASTPNLCLRGVPQRALPKDPVRVGDTLRLRAGGFDILYECDNAPPPAVGWVSSDSTIAHVDQMGQIIARRAGTAYVSARARWSTAMHPIHVRE